MALGRPNVRFAVGFQQHRHCSKTVSISSEGLLPQLVPHLRQNRTALREEWARRITEAELLTAMTPEEIFSEATSVYDNYVEVLETGSVEALQAYARDLSERIIPRGVETDEVRRHRAAAARRAGPLAVREVPDRLRPAEPRAGRLRAGGQPHRQHRGRRLRAGARAHHPPAAGGHPRAVHAGAAGARAAADPADHRRDRQPARPPAHRAAAAGIRANRAKVVVIDITGVPTIDSTVANHLVQTVDASRLMGASVIITGLSSEIALTLVTIGVDLSKMNAVGDLQGGIEEAERLLGYEVTRTGEQTTANRQLPRASHASTHPQAGRDPHRHRCRPR